MTATTAPAPARSAFRRPTAEHGWTSWLTTVDHKRIGLMYGATAMAFFVLGGIEALVLRLQLAGAERSVVNADQYSQLFTMHGLTMIFFAVMPLSAAFFNYFIPLMIGTRDVAFPRLNALSYWLFLFAGLFTYSSVVMGGLPDTGWFSYAPLSLVGGDPAGYTVGESTLAALGAHRTVFYALGLQIAGLASLVASVNFVVTILNHRAPGMTLLRMPLFIWMSLITNFLLLFAMPVIGVALWQLLMDTAFNGKFFNPAAGGDPILWQHLFWLFGHPEVYIIILPAFGIVSEVLPTFSRKPLFGYSAMVFSGIAIGFMGWGVWAHHMFAVGLGPVANTAFGLSTMFIAVPTGVKIFNWIATIWGGKLRFSTPMLFAIGTVAMFTIGGLSGVTHSVVPHNYQQTDSYYVVAHFHYVMFGGAVFGLFSGIYYWWPKFTGRMLNEGLGKLHFWLQFVGFNLTFGPMHRLGLRGMPRRVWTYPDGYGWNFWNLAATVGAFTIATGVLVFLVNAYRHRANGQSVGHDPWDARTLEWLTTSPPPAHNFDRIPVVAHRDELWHRKYDEHGAPLHPVAAAGGDGDDPAHPSAADAPTAEAVGYDEGLKAGQVHMPSPSYYPLVAAAGIALAAYGPIISTPGAFVFYGLGALLGLGGFFGWVLEPSAEAAADHQDPTQRTTATAVRS